MLHTNNTDPETCHLWKVPVLVHAPDIPQVTARGNKSPVTGQEMCCHMYLPSPGGVFTVVRQRGGDGNHSAHRASILFLKSPHKTTRAVCFSAVVLFLFRVLFSTLSSPSTSSEFTLLHSSHCPHLQTCSLSHTDQCQAGNVPGIYTVEPTGALHHTIMSNWNNQLHC